MQIIEPKAEYWPQTNMYEHIANIASVCYHSPKKEGEKAQKMVEGLIKRGHISPTRHASMYFIIKEAAPIIWTNLSAYASSPYIDIMEIKQQKGIGNFKTISWAIATNYNFLLDNEYLYAILAPYQVTPEEFIKECPELMRFTFCLTTQISTSRELSRKSPNNIMEESTRYILYAENGKAEPAICRPHWMSKVNAERWNKQEDWLSVDSETGSYVKTCNESFETYKWIVSRGMKQENARGVLPLDTKTTVIYTYSVKEWSDIFKLRYLDMTGKAHPNCKVIMGLVLKEFNKLGYNLNENGDLIYCKLY